MSLAAAENYTHTKTGNRLVFSYYPAFAKFIRHYHIIDYIKEAIKLSREVDLPLLRYISHIPDEQLIEMGLPQHIAFLESVENNTLDTFLKESLKRWENDELEIIGKDDLAADDIALTSYIRKQALLRFVHLYTSNVNDIIHLVKEIDIYEMEACRAATETYIKLLQQKIHRHARFIESITNTTPGIIYVYDCVKKREIYTNNKVSEFLGYTHEDLELMGSNILAHLVHPDERERMEQHSNDCENIQDGEIRYLEYRIKTKEGKYKWVRTCEAVFSRNTDGSIHEKIGIAIDIDGQKQVEELLHQKENQLLEAQELVNMGSYKLHLATGALEVTPQYLKIFEINDKPDRDTLMKGIHPADAQRLKEIREQAIQENGEYDFEYRHYVNGKEKIIWSRGAVSETPEGKIMKGTLMDVTDRHYMLQRLQRSENLYKQAQAMTHIGNWVWDLVRNKLEWSDELYRMYGLEPGTEISQEIIGSYNHPDDVQNVRNIIQSSLETSAPYDFHYRIINQQGQLLTLHAKGEVIADETGRPYKMRGTLQDVTEKQILIEKLQQSEKLYKQAQSISHVGNWTWDMKTDTIQWSDELYNIFGLEPQGEKITLERYLSFIQPADREKVGVAIQNTLATLQPFENIYNAILPNGEAKTIHSKGEVETDIHGNPVKMYGTCQDVTVEKMVEEQLKHNTEFIQKITDVTPSIITTYNIHTGQYTFVNRGAVVLLGYTAAEVLEKGIPFITSLVHPDDMETLMEKNAEAIATANTLDGDKEMIAEFKYRVKHKNGEYRWLHTYGTVFDRNEKGEVEHVLNVSVDITEQEIAEQALHLKNIQLQQSNASLEEYAHVASHDLKEPLRKISTFGDRLLASQNDRLDENGKTYLGKIINASGRMQTMIQDLLSVSMITGDKSFEKASLQTILDDVLQTLEYKIEETNAVITSNGLPVASCVPSQMRQLFQNIISNSLKFSRKGISPAISVKHRYLTPSQIPGNELVSAQKYLQLIISDNGIGFDNSYAGKIFTIFQRLHGKSEYEGNGIGLAICKKIAENHGGIIYAESAEGMGTTFFIIIPAL